MNKHIEIAHSDGAEPSLIFLISLKVFAKHVFAAGLKDPSANDYVHLLLI